MNETFLKCRISMSFPFLHVLKQKRQYHGKRKNGNFKWKHKNILSNSELNILLKSGRHQMLSKLFSLSISSLLKLAEEANKFYDRKHDLYEAALLTWYYTQHDIRPYIDSEIGYHIRHFINNPFINKGIEFIDLPSILREILTSSIPSYLEIRNPQLFFTHITNLYVILYLILTN